MSGRRQCGTAPPPGDLRPERPLPARAEIAMTVVVPRRLVGGFLLPRAWPPIQLRWRNSGRPNLLQELLDGCLVLMRSVRSE